MGGANMSRKSALLDPAGALMSDLTGSDTLAKIANPTNLFTGPVAKKMDASQIASEKEAAKQDELLKKLALGENPYLETTDTKTETLGV